MVLSLSGWVDQNKAAVQTDDTVFWVELTLSIDLVLMPAPANAIESDKTN